VTENEISRHVVDAAYRLHKALGPGLREEVYEKALASALSKRGLLVQRQLSFPVIFDGEVVSRGFKVDLMVNDSVIVEVKSLERLALVHRKQLLTYLRMADKRLGLLINFGSGRIKDGIVRMVNGLAE
jgi:GxxExxY protein